MTINTGIHQPIAAPKPVDIGHLTGLTLNVPEWFADPEFCEWLNRDDTWVFTWHEKGTVPSDFSDVVVTLEPSCTGEGSASDMPQRFWDSVVNTCKREIGENNSNFHYLVRLTNL
jgi:hypothetical protein